MLKSALALIQNTWRTRVLQETYLEPLLAVLYITKLCNYSCSYCSEYGAWRNAEFKKETMNTEEAMEVLRIIRQGCEGIYFTGGEPTLRNDIVALARYCKKDLRFGVTALNTNGSLLGKREELFEYIDSMVVSLDTMDAARADKIYKMPSGTTARVIRYLREFAAQQLQRGFELVINCVTGPDNIDDANEVFDFCLENGIEFSIQILELDGIGPHPKLKGHPGFSALVDRAIREKRKNHKSVSGSMTYLMGLKEMQPFHCFPSLNPRIDPLGGLYWPCHPLSGEQGGTINLREHGSWDAAIEYARATYGDPPAGCQRCYLRCYAEFSLLAQKPHLFTGVVLQKLTQALARRFSAVV